MRHAFFHFIERAKLARHRLLRPLRLGVRCLVIAKQAPGPEQVLLVRHTYINGWYMPGGGVDPGESAAEAAMRELREETNIECLEPPRLHGLYFKRRSRDHVALYVVRAFHSLGPREPDFEIAEMRFFPIDTLPDGTSPATHARIAEILKGAPFTETW